MAQTQYTPTIRANAARLAESAATWTRGHRKVDGRPFVLFPSGSRPGQAYYADREACTCPGFLHRGACSHVAAVRIANQDEAWARLMETASPDEMPPSAHQPGEDEITLAKLLHAQDQHTKRLLLTGWQRDELWDNGVWAERAGHIDRIKARIKEAANHEGDGGSGE